MNISLTKEQEKFVQKKVASGQYATASEVIREGLRLLADQDKLRQMRIAELRREIAKGMADADAGRFVDGPTALKRIMDDLRKKHAKPSTK